MILKCVFQFKVKVNLEPIEYQTVCSTLSEYLGSTTVLYDKLDTFTPEWYYQVCLQIITSIYTADPQ